MKSLASICAAALLIALGQPTATAASSDIAASAKAKPLRPISQCLATSQVRDWKVLDAQRLLVKSLGGRYYDIELSHACRELPDSTYISFRDGLQPVRWDGFRWSTQTTARDPLSSDGRICGDLGDAVIPLQGVRNHADIPCDIARIQRIERAAYEAAGGESAARTRRSGLVAAAYD